MGGRGLVLEHRGNMGEMGQMIPHPKHIQQSHIFSAALFFNPPQKMMLQHQL